MEKFFFFAILFLFVQMAYGRGDMLTWHQANSQCKQLGLTSFKIDLQDIENGENEGTETINDARWTAGTIIYSLWLSLQKCYFVKDKPSSRFSLTKPEGLHKCIMNGNNKSQFIYLNNDSCSTDITKKSANETRGQSCGNHYPDLLCGSTSMHFCQYEVISEQRKIFNVKDPHPLKNCGRCFGNNQTIQEKCDEKHTAPCTDDQNETDTWLNMQIKCTSYNKTCDGNSLNKMWSSFIRHTALVMGNSNFKVQFCIAKLGAKFIYISCDEKLSFSCANETDQTSTLVSSDNSSFISSTELTTTTTITTMMVQIEAKSLSTSNFYPIIYAFSGVAVILFIILVSLIIYRRKILKKRNRQKIDQPQLETFASTIPSYDQGIPNKNGLITENSVIQTPGTSNQKVEGQDRSPQTNNTGSAEASPVNDTEKKVMSSPNLGTVSDAANSFYEEVHEKSVYRSRSYQQGESNYDNFDSKKENVYDYDTFSGKQTDTQRVWDTTREQHYDTMNDETLNMCDYDTFKGNLDSNSDYDHLDT